MSPQPTHRRSARRLLAGIVVLCTGFVPVLVRADVTTPVLAINAEVAGADITVQPVRGNISALIGSGGNIGVLTTPDGKLMVDAGIAVSKPKLIAALQGLGDSPVKILINTHYHWDHTDGNAWLHEAGATIVAHENTRARLTTGTRVIDWAYHFPAVPAAGLPTIVFNTTKTMQFGDQTIVLKHYRQGHTDSDVTVHFKQADVLQVGDIWWNGHYPFIDYSAGGSIDGVIREVDGCIKDATARTVIIPGHGPLGNRAELIEFREMLVTIRNNVARLKRQGKTLAETVAARPTAAYDAKFGTFLIDAAFFTHLVYMGV